MAQKYTPKVVTANHLLDGDVIYLDRDKKWTRQLHNALLLTDQDEANSLLASAEAQASEVVGVYLADADCKDGAPTPTHFREAFRMRGPSNLFHGKQADV